jgi:hypothetical protein
MNLYDVAGYDQPLLLSEEHAELIGATEHDLVTGTPSLNANKPAWVAFAVAQGTEPAVAEAMTRADLIEQFG